MELRGFEPLTPCMPYSFDLLSYPRSDAKGPLNDPLRVTVIVRWTPLVTAAYGTAGENHEKRTWRRRLPAWPDGEARPR
jgi:hypothetical protein